MGFRFVFQFFFYNNFNPCGFFPGPASQRQISGFDPLPQIKRIGFLHMRKSDGIVSNQWGIGITADLTHYYITNLIFK